MPKPEINNSGSSFTRVVFNTYYALGIQELNTHNRLRTVAQWISFIKTAVPEINFLRKKYINPQKHILSEARRIRRLTATRKEIEAANQRHEVLRKRFGKYVIAVGGGQDIDMYVQEFKTRRDADIAVNSTWQYDERTASISFAKDGSILCFFDPKRYSAEGFNVPLSKHLTSQILIAKNFPVGFSPAEINPNYSRFLLNILHKAKKAVITSRRGNI